MTNPSERMSKDPREKEKITPLITATMLNRLQGSGHTPLGPTNFQTKGFHSVAPDVYYVESSTFCFGDSLTKSFNRQGFKVAFISFLFFPP